MHKNHLFAKIKKVHPDAIIPQYKSDGAAAMDLYSTEDCTLFPGTRAMISTGIAIQLPDQYEGQVRARSGLASKGIIVLNGPGTIDCDFRGEIKVLLANIGTLTVEQCLENIQNLGQNTSVKPLHKLENFVIKAGDRIAQLLIAPVWKVTWEEFAHLDETARGSGGFGSTGSR